MRQIFPIFIAQFFLLASLVLAAPSDDLLGYWKLDNNANDSATEGVNTDNGSSVGKFSPHDLLESIIEPSKEINDQCGSMTFTLKNKKQVVGRIVNLRGETCEVITDLIDPDK